MEFIIETKTLPQLFVRAAEQITRTVHPQRIKGAGSFEKLSVEAIDPSLLLQDWISLILRIFHERHLVFSTFDVRQLGPKGDGWFLQVEAMGPSMVTDESATDSSKGCRRAELSGDEKSCRAVISLGL